MTLEVADNTAPTEELSPIKLTPEGVKLRIQSLHGEQNHDAVRDEALALANKLELTQHRVRKLSAYHQELRHKLEALTAHEHYCVVITDVLRNGELKVEVAGLRTNRVQVAVHPGIDPNTLLVGALGHVAREGNCLLKVSDSEGRWKDVATFERYLDPPHRILLRDRETLVAVDVAHHLRKTQLQRGDLIGFDRETAGMAYKRLDAPRRDHLFDEDVADDFAQLAGLDTEIVRIKRHIDFRFRFPQLATKYSLKSKCGILLHGKPGNGKTRIARCCAGYVRQLFPDRPCRFMHIAGSSDYNMWFGETERKLTERFSAVRQAAADGLVVMFWDEIDAIAKCRGAEHGSATPDRILNTLLSQIDGVVPLSNVIMLFATNRAYTLDPSLLRPGRTDERIEIPTPNRRATDAILRCYVDRRPLAAPLRDAVELIAPLLSQLFSPNGTYAEVARVKLSDGRRLPVPGRELLSGAMLENVAVVAAQQAAVREAETGQEGLTDEDLSLALETELIGAVSMLSPATVKSYVNSIPQDAQPIGVEPVLRASTSLFVRAR